jgi:hypothetical protein
MKRFRSTVRFTLIASLSSVTSCHADSPTLSEDAVGSVVVSFDTLTIAIGQTVQASAIIRDALGNSVPGIVITWTSANPGIAAVTSYGLIRGVAPGTTQIVASADGHTGAATVTTRGPAPEPGPNDIILVRDDFERDAASIKTGYATRGAMTTTDGHSSGTAIRFLYSSGSQDNLVEKSFAETKDIYIRYWYRLSPSADPTCGGHNPSGFKWFMTWRASGLPRYTMGVGDLGNNAGLEFSTHDNGSNAMPNPFLQNKTKTPRFGTTRDGQWHKYTLHVVTGSGGYEQIWVDDALVLDSSGLGYDHASGGIGTIQFPGAVVDFSGCTSFTIDADDLVIWRRSP